MSPIFWIIIIVLILILVLVGWLLIRNTQTTNEKRKLNQSCSKTSDCNTGLVCNKTEGSTVGVCKVSNGGVCTTTSDCSSDSTCQDGVCVAGSGVDKPCPCGEGLTCVNNVCKVAIGETCNSDEECASGMCQCNVCVVTDPHSVHVSKKMINELVSMLECGKCKKESRSCECSESIPSKSDCSSNSKYSTNSSYPNRKRYSRNSTSSELSSSSEYSYNSNKSHKSGCKYLTSGSSTDCSCDKSSFTVSK